MKTLEQAARYEGLFWAESTLAAFQSTRRVTPSVWPGTIERARELVDCFTDEMLDPLDREWLAGVVLQSARALWREIARPDISDAGAISMVTTRGRNRHRLLRNVRHRAA